MSTMNTVGRPTTPNTVDHDYKHPTLTGGRGLLQDEHLIFESDGWGKYDLADPEAAKRHLTNEKRREDRLRRNRHPFGRWDYAGAVRVGPLTEALESAQVRRVGAPDRARLATLQRTPRSRGR